MAIVLNCLEFPPAVNPIEQRWKHDAHTDYSVQPDVDLPVMFPVPVCTDLKESQNGPANPEHNPVNKEEGGNFWEVKIDAHLIINYKR